MINAVYCDVEGVSERFEVTGHEGMKGRKLRFEDGEVMEWVRLVNVKYPFTGKKLLDVEKTLTGELRYCEFSDSQVYPVDVGNKKEEGGDKDDVYDEEVKAATSSPAPYVQDILAHIAANSDQISRAAWHLMDLYEQHRRVKYEHLRFLAQVADSLGTHVGTMEGHVATMAAKGVKP